MSGKEMLAMAEVGLKLVSELAVAKLDAKDAEIARLQSELAHDAATAERFAVELMTAKQAIADMAAQIVSLKSEINDWVSRSEQAHAAKGELLAFVRLIAQGCGITINIDEDARALVAKHGGGA